MISKMKTLWADSDKSEKQATWACLGILGLILLTVALFYTSPAVIEFILLGLFIVLLGAAMLTTAGCLVYMVWMSLQEFFEWRNR